MENIGDAFFGDVAFAGSKDVNGLRRSFRETDFP
jgi:hypothetical protein